MKKGIEEAPSYHFIPDVTRGFCMYPIVLYVAKYPWNINDKSKNTCRALLTSVSRISFKNYSIFNLLIT